MIKNYKLKLDIGGGGGDIIGLDKNKGSERYV